MNLFFIVLFLIPLFTIPAFGQEMGFYKNEAYDFSFEIPMNWLIEENVPLPTGQILQAVMYPDDFNRLFSVDIPLIGIYFQNIPERDVPNLNSEALEKYALDDIRINIPNARIVSSDVESTSWGWIVTTEIRYSVPQVEGQFYQEDNWFFFKDRESYDVAFTAIETSGYYDTYYPVYENVLETLVLKGVVVPEFHEIAIMILGSGIIGIIALSKKFGILKH